ncbi:MAG: PKD domain-containing protein [Bacteroidetes bacterium]|nr:PKD domain-containing protein [Bacteroidota bacterium]
MKNILTYLPLVLGFLFLLNSGRSVAQCNANFTYTLNANGNVQFMSAVSPTTTSYYSWNFGNSATATGSITDFPAITYTANGTYIVGLWYTTTVPTCSVYSQQTITISNAITSTCNVNANFSYTQGSNGAVTFTSTSTGTVPGTTYSWMYGDASANGSGATTSHTYAANGFYNVTLYANNNFTATCADSVQIAVMVNSYPCLLNAGFTYTQGVNGLINFSSTSTGTAANTSYSWDFGNSTFGSGANASKVYTNGTYTVTLMIANSSFTFCSSTATQVITVTTNTCNLISNYSYTTGSLGSINFQSTSTATTPTTTYSWDFGDLTPFGTGAAASHTYQASGWYLAILYAIDGTCTDSMGYYINVTNVPCNINAGFTYTQSTNGLVNFTSVSTGTNPGTTFYWNFGNSNFGSGASTNHSFANGTYTVSLTVTSNSATCSDSTMQVITVTSNTCNISANYTHTVGANGLVNFNNTATGTNSNTVYYWNFGDGFTSTSQSPSHTYGSSGAYNVYFLASQPGCYDSIIQSINVTGIPCIANSNFSLAPTTATLVWNATPASPWNVVAATWNWGDNTTSNTLYTSHNYSASGTYSVCLSVTVSCGSSASTCVNQFIYKTSSQNMQMITINVVPPSLTTTGINPVEFENFNYAIYPNPNNGQFELTMDGLGNETVKIKIYNLIGEVVYETETVKDNLVKKINLDNVSNGVYFVKINSGNKESTKKIIVNN